MEEQESWYEGVDLDEMVREYLEEKRLNEFQLRSVEKGVEWWLASLDTGAPEVETYFYNTLPEVIDVSLSNLEV